MIPWFPSWKIFSRRNVYFDPEINPKQMLARKQQHIPQNTEIQYFTSLKNNNSSVQNKCTLATQQSELDHPRVSWLTNRLIVLRIVKAKLIKPNLINLHTYTFIQFINWLLAIGRIGPCEVVRASNTKSAYLKSHPLKVRPLWMAVFLPDR